MLKGKPSKKPYRKIKINENWYSDSNMRNYRKKYNNLNLKQRKDMMEICEIENKKKIAYKLQWEKAVL